MAWLRLLLKIPQNRTRESHRMFQTALRQNFMQPTQQNAARVFSRGGSTCVPDAMQHAVLHGVILRKTGTVPNTEASRPGLTPAIHLLRKNLAKIMDARVKPAHDE